jgi:hypothetical protein
MENFFNYISKPLRPEDVDIWFRVNNIVNEKLELFSDFSHSLNELIVGTYLGESNQPNETKIILSETDKLNHFNWCWKKIITNFEKEGIMFNVDGEHYDYFLSFFNDIYYNQDSEDVKHSIHSFLNELYDTKKLFTKSDLDMVLSFYQVLNKNLNH